MTKVIELGKLKKDDERVFTVVGGEPCKHDAILIDSKNRIVKCQSCKEQINAFDALLNVANIESNQRKVLDEHRSKIDRIRAVYNGLVKKLKSMTRYKCRHCGKYNEAVAKQGWDDEVTGVDFRRVFDKDGE